MKWILRGLLGLAAVLAVAFLVFRTPDTDAAAMRAKYGGPPSQFVTIGNGVRVHLRDEGPRDAPAIILLHGSNADLHTWEPWAAALRSQYRVIRFDQVGHGLTGPDPAHDYSRDNYVADVLEVADAMGLAQFVLAGNSMGGKHALAFATAHPDRLSGLVLVDASGGPMLAADEEEDKGSGNIGFAIAQTPGINRLAEQITPRSLIAQSLEQSISVKAVADEAAVDRYWELLRYPGNRRATLKRFGYPYDPISTADIAGIAVPTLILWGQEDRLIPVESGRWLARTMPNAELVVYPAIGHLPHEEAPQATLDRLKPWLAKHALSPKTE
ncbi:alpha/beta fold hydrolase [Erythrobacter sp. R86502]|uniref:alpha/beta fold hydrolase n=1 Tax=Erythrobacter sp. R86502 TaxID=3093846 RepID=UPI0036D30345